MQQFQLKKQSVLRGILTPSVLVPGILTSCLLGAFPMSVFAEHLDLPSIEVTAERIYENSIPKSNTGDTAQLLEDEPGLSLYQAGGVSSLPVIHGLADDRIRIKVDGMDLISSCANHMNPPLSYSDPSNVESIKVFAGITPVSVGGDSIAGTIIVNSASPEFAQAGQDLLIKAQVGTFYRSNNDARGVNLSTSVANDKVYMRYTGSTVEANNYTAGGNFKPAGLAAVNRSANRAKDRGYLAGDEVGSSYYKARNQALAFGVKLDNHLVELKLGLQDIPYQGFANQRMDMTGNDSQQYNLSYAGQYGWGNLEARVYNEKTRHSMQMGDDKLFWYGGTGTVAGMPMDTEGKTSGVNVKGNVNLSQRDTLHVGAEYQRYRLDDWWNPVANSAMMSPNTFWNINNGQRDRYDMFAEWEAKWSSQWLSQLGLRSSTVKMDADNVQGYSTMMYGAAATAFNKADRSKTDNNIDMTALARFTPDASQTFEAGYAMKTRSPNVYERFAWANSNTMVMNMNNWVGDGNGYVGNLKLKPETAHTLSATANWHDAVQQNWQFKATPYLTYVDDYIDAVACAKVGKTCAVRTDGFVNLSLDNQSAKLYGVDVSGKKLLTAGSGFGRFSATGTVNYVRGKNRTTGDDLYNIMPLNAKLALEHKLGGWTNTIQTKLVDSKDNVQAIRKELKTAGYGLLNLYSSYEWKYARLDLGVENVFDKYYANPLGGAYVGQGATMGTDVLHGVTVPGMGRSINVGLTLNY
ncbi:MAG: TonB-dependent receptor [Methylotenera sp. RIFCSPLOWO2_02_FULL_45_14]|nr:MAG: TonB-dependent receptor [Methylotenera sp. RIFCSPLOWO2_02_FULL_45_14]